jgi:hypothetical protein
VVCESSEAAALQEELVGHAEIWRRAALWVLQQGGEVGDSSGRPLLKNPQQAVWPGFQVAEANLKGSQSVTDAALKTLHWSPNLERLDLSKTPITDEALFELRKFPRLHYLNVEGTQITEAAVEAFRKVKPDCEVVR